MHWNLVPKLTGNDFISCTFCPIFQEKEKYINGKKNGIATIVGHGQTQFEHHFINNILNGYELIYFPSRNEDMYIFYIDRIKIFHFEIKTYSYDTDNFKNYDENIKKRKYRYRES